MDNLQPGDLCVITEPSKPDTYPRSYIGKTVILVQINERCKNPSTSGFCCPHWEVIGENTWRFSWTVLRKIHPDFDSNEQSIEDFCEDIHTIKKLKETENV